MTWKSDVVAQRACLKGICALGLQGLKYIYYSILF